MKLTVSRIPDVNDTESFQLESQKLDVENILVTRDEIDRFSESSDYQSEIAIAVNGIANAHCLTLNCDVVET